jgi:hypothetical protein
LYRNRVSDFHAQLAMRGKNVFQISDQLIIKVAAEPTQSTTPNSDELALIDAY